MNYKTISIILLIACGILFVKYLQYEDVAYEYGYQLCSDNIDNDLDSHVDCDDSECMDTKLESPCITVEYLGI